MKRAIIDGEAPPTEAASYHAKKLRLIPASPAVPATTEKNQYDEKDD
jgi:hypothetical protein